MGTTEARTDEDWFAILDALRENGSINMFEAPGWLEEQFFLDKQEAKRIFMAWWDKYGEK